MCGLSVAAWAPSNAHAADSLSSALAQSKPSLSLRLRSEAANQDNAARDARANTLRHRLGLASGDWHGLRAYLESEGVVAIGDENYNSGPGGNGHSDYSVIADPTGNELNQAYLHWKFNEMLQLRTGRQRIIFDNARFIGNVGWRQNEQTFDAAWLKLDPAADVSLQYAYVSNVNRIFFSNADLDGHLLNAQFKLNPALHVSAYGYWLDYLGGEDSQTLGLRLGGKLPVAELSLSYQAEIAQQSEYADSSFASDADYVAAELGLSAQGVLLAVGIEQLGGDGVRGFSTPLATGHKFNGWADLFLATPANGLNDLYVKTGYKSGRFAALGFWHGFSADSGNQDYGSEIDLLLSYQFQPRLKGNLKFASYRSDGFGVDTDKLTAELNFSL